MGVPLVSLNGLVVLDSAGLQTALQQILDALQSQERQLSEQEARLAGLEQELCSAAASAAAAEGRAEGLSERLAEVEELLGPLAARVAEAQAEAALAKAAAAQAERCEALERELSSVQAAVRAAEAEAAVQARRSEAIRQELQQQVNQELQRMAEAAQEANPEVGDVAKLFEAHLREVERDVSVKASASSVDALRRDLERSQKQMQNVMVSLRHCQTQLAKAEQYMSAPQRQPVGDEDHDADPHCLLCGHARSPSPPPVLMGRDGIAYGHPADPDEAPPGPRTPMQVRPRPTTPTIPVAQVTPPAPVLVTSVDGASAGTTSSSSRRGRRETMRRGGGPLDGAEPAAQPRGLARQGPVQVPAPSVVEARPTSSRPSSAGSVGRPVRQNQPLRAYLGSHGSLPVLGRAASEVQGLVRQEAA